MRTERFQVGDRVLIQDGGLVSFGTGPGTIVAPATNGDDWMVQSDDSSPSFPLSWNEESLTLLELETQIRDKEIRNRVKYWMEVL